MIGTSGRRRKGTSGISLADTPGIHPGRVMPEDLTFMMGKFAARLPGDLLYARNHMWSHSADGRRRFGFTAYAVRLMQDVYFLDWCVNAGDAVALKQQI